MFLDRRHYSLAFFVFWMFCSYAQTKTEVIIDNDFAGDPDGLYALAHLMKSNSADVKAIVCSHLHEGENWSEPGAAAPFSGVNEVKQLQKIMQTEWSASILPGAEVALADTQTPIASDGATHIVAEALKHDSNNPLFVLVGGGLTEIASAWLLNPDIESRIVLIWIGGEEYPGTIPVPREDAEYNTTIDVRAAQVVFNKSNIPIWQVPRNAYRQCLVSRAILSDRLGGSVVGQFLNAKLQRFIGPGHNAEAYVLGDNPLVLLSVLRSNWEPDASSSNYEWRDCPTVTDSGRFRFVDNGRKVRVYTSLDTYLLFEDMYAKIK